MLGPLDSPRLTVAVDLAVKVRGWPTQHARPTRSVRGSEGSFATLVDTGRPGLGEPTGKARRRCLTTGTWTAGPVRASDVSSAALGKQPPGSGPPHTTAASHEHRSPPGPAVALPLCGATLPTTTQLAARSAPARCVYSHQTQGPGRDPTPDVALTPSALDGRMMGAPPAAPCSQRLRRLISLGQCTRYNAARALKGRPRARSDEVVLHSTDRAVRTALAGTDPASALTYPVGLPAELAIMGALAAASIAPLRSDTVVSACRGVAPQRQITTHNPDDAAVKQGLLIPARRRISVLDGTRSTHSTKAVVCQLSAVDVVVTDSTAPDSEMGELTAARSKVRHV